MTNEDIGGWGEEKSSPIKEDTLASLPTAWEGVGREEKVQHLIAVAQRQITRLRGGNFSFHKTQEVAALMLEVSMELAELLAEAEAQVRQDKLEVQYVEGEAASEILKQALQKKQKRPSEAALKRDASIADEVKKANDALLESEKTYRKYRYINDVIKEAHILFRNLEK